jgi:hypothetical protein
MSFCHHTVGGKAQNPLPSGSAMIVHFNRPPDHGSLVGGVHQGVADVAPLHDRAC